MSSVHASSEWTQTSDSDFDNGTHNNTIIKGTGNNAELAIDLPFLNNWMEINTTIHPGLRYGHTMATIYTTKKVLLYGGNDGLVSSYNDTWLFDLDNKTWTNMTPINDPGARYDHAMAPIWGTDKLVLFGGLNGVTLGDTWLYDLSDNNWIQKAPITKPIKRAKHAMASVIGEDKVMLFGGEGNAPPYFYNDTWIYDLSNDTWTNMNPTNKPSGRYAHAMASFYNTDKILMFGGSSGSWEHDTWIYDFSENKWTQKSPVIYPSGRRDHSLATIGGNDLILLFGGYESAGIANDTWLYNYKNNVWIERNLSNKPKKTYMHSMASLNGTDKIVLFGGYLDPGTSNETWLYEHILPTINGTFISNPFDTNTSSSFITINWFGKTAENTSIKIQLRTALTEQNLFLNDFVGPDGLNSSFYESSPSNIWIGHEGDQWIQYKVFFNMSTFSISPALKDITIIYNCIPTIKLLNPINNSYLAENKPTFSWIFNDYDSETQNAFQVLIDDNLDFQNINFDSGKQISAQESWEFSTGTNYTSLSDGVWYWKVRTQDPDDKWSDYSKAWNLTIDTTSPSSSITEPKNNDVLNKLIAISGIAIDPLNGSGISKIELSLKCNNNDFYWNGSDWITDISWDIVEGKSNWTYDTSKIKWISGNSYSLRSRAIDILNNIESSTESIIFSYDSSTPISEITFPINNSLLNNLNFISGNSIDKGGAGLDFIEICIKSNDNNSYWNGLNWITSKNWHHVSGTNFWVYNTSKTPFVTGYHYSINVRGHDGVGNIEISKNITTFKFDNSPPQAINITINNGEDFVSDTNVTLSLKAKDIGFGISDMSFSIDNKKWSIWEDLNDTKSYNLPIGDGEKTIYFKVKDLAGNIGDPIFDTIILDTTPPLDLSIKINNNAKYTNNDMVTLTLTANDDFSGLSKMRFSYDGIDWLQWESFQFVKSFLLLHGEGEKRVFVMVKDNVNNIAEPTYDSIILDTIPPHSLSIIINKGEINTNITKVNITLQAFDNTSGVDKISLSTDKKNWTYWEDFTHLRTYDLSSGDGKKYIFFKVKDKAGNIAEPVSDSIILSTLDKNNVTQKPDKSSSDWDFWTILSIIIIICCISIIIISVIIINQRKRAANKLLAKSAKLIKLGGGEAPVSVVSIGKIPSTLELPQLPPTTAMSGEPQSISEISSIPVLVAPGQSSQSKSVGQIIQGQQLPQLPPVKSENKSIEVENNQKIPMTSSQTELNTTINNTAIKMDSSVNNNDLDKKSELPQPIVVTKNKSNNLIIENQNLNDVSAIKSEKNNSPALTAFQKENLPDSSTRQSNYEVKPPINIPKSESNFDSTLLNTNKVQEPNGYPEKSVKKGNNETNK